MHDRRPRLFAATLLASFLFANGARAQAGLGHLEDASLAPKGLLRLRAITVWTRFDTQFGANGVEPLGARLTADSLGVRQIPALSQIESRVQSATALPFTLTLGRSRLDATARTEILPLGLEYGLTSRFTIGVTVPIVRKRAAMLFRLDTAGGFGANVGPNAHRTSTAVAQNNAVVQAEFASAAQQLQQRLSDCQANPAGAGCAALLARQPEADQLIQASQSFATVVGSLFGTSTTAGMAFVPTGQSAAQAAIVARIVDFNARYRDLLSASADLLSAVPSAAGGPAGSASFQQYLVEEVGGDSLTMLEGMGIGDIEVGFKMLVLDRPRSARQRTGIQLAVASSLRIPTGSTQSPNDFLDLRFGEGRFVVDSRVIVDLRAGRLGVLAIGQYATALPDAGTPITPDANPFGLPLQTENSNWTEFHVAPRWHFSEPLAIHAAYSLRSSDKLGGDQLAGVGVSFSTLSGYTGGILPIEMRFTHLESISGDAGRPKFFRDQIELRIYFRLRR